MRIVSMIVYVLTGFATLYFVQQLVGGWGMWSLLLAVLLLGMLFSLRIPRLQPFIQVMCLVSSLVTALFIAMSLVGSTIGSGMSDEFKPLFACFVVLCVSGLFVALPLESRPPNSER